MIAMNEPLALERALVGREMYFPPLNWLPFVPVVEASFVSSVQSHEPARSCSSLIPRLGTVENSAFFNRLTGSRAHYNINRAIDLKTYEVSLQILASETDGFIFSQIVSLSDFTSFSTFLNKVTF